jgi:superfamily II DNA or RNA helicase
MTRITFEPIAGTTGNYQSNLELEIRTLDSDRVKKILTMKNKSVEWKLSFLLKKLKYWRSIMDDDGEPNVANESLRQQAIAAKNRQRDKAIAKIAEIEPQVEALRPLVKEELFTDIGSSLIVPPGMWFLCESIRGNTHLNTDIKPYILPDCQNRPYQVEALTELFKYNRATTELATGLGKSKIIHSLAIAAVLSRKRCMVVVPSEYLVGQMYDQLKALHPNTTAQGGGRQAEPGWDILVTTVQSAQMYADIPDMILLDEAHHAPAETWTGLLCKADKAEHVYSFTATAFRADGLDMAIHAFAGPVVYSRDVRWGIDNHYLSDFRVFQYVVNPRYTSGRNKGKLIRLSDHIQPATAYKILSTAPEILAIMRDKVIKGTEKGRKPIIIFKTVESCKALRRFCQQPYGDLPLIDLDVASAQNGGKSKAPLRRFQKGDANILLANGPLIAEGVDIPAADMLILGTQNSGDVATLQMIGRVLRMFPGKREAIVIDIQTNGFGQFERAGEKRRELYLKILGPDKVNVITV